MNTDASDYGVGGVLYQVKEGKVHIIAITSKSLTPVQRRWSTADKEAYAIVYCFKKFEYLIKDIHFTLKTDHKNLTYINLENSGKVRRWKIEIQDFDFDIEHVEGKQNGTSDGLSRLIDIIEPTSEELNVLTEEYKIPQINTKSYHVHTTLPWDTME